MTTVKGEIMPLIRPSADLKDKYNEISQICHEYTDPVFITKNGTGDLAVMSIEAYESLVGRMQLYTLLDEGFEAARQGRVKPADDVFASIRDEMGF
jgi:PHD/YefM family antitoxin component YafN of YafNO toxin-antitoxin module